MFGVILLISLEDYERNLLSRDQTCTIGKGGQNWLRTASNGFDLVGKIDALDRIYLLTDFCPTLTTLKNFCLDTFVHGKFYSLLLSWSLNLSFDD